MFEIRKPIPIQEAISRIMKHTNKGDFEYISISDCDHRIIVEDIVASHPVPPFDKSPYDGFAIRSIDSADASASNPITFEVIEQVGAGHVPTKPIKKNQAIRIMTGAMIPKEADCVAMFEVCQTFENNNQSFMTLKRKMQIGENIIPKGSETTQGEVLVKAGTVINPGIKALLATFGYAKVKVAKRPKIGLFATGTELLDVEDELVPGKIRNSNAYMISSQINRAGGEPIYFGKLVDDFDTCFDAVSNALEQVDMLITTGGVSVGDFDLMPHIYEKLNAQVLFNKVGMRPGSVTTVAVKDGQFLFGLSGNPSACYVGFELFTRPVIQNYLHANAPFVPKIQATLDADFPKANPFTRFVRSYIHYKDGQVFVSPAGMDKSAVVTSLASTNALMVLPGGSRGYQRGAQVDVLLLETINGSATTWEI